jgi:hypothetical protein
MTFLLALLGLIMLVIIMMKTCRLLTLQASVEERLIPISCEKPGSKISTLHVSTITSFQEMFT